MKYIQFIAASTGYVKGSVPPRFKKSNIKPIDALGTFSRRRLDGRYSLETCIIEAHSCYALNHKNESYIGFKIVQAVDFRDEGRVLYTWTDEKKLKQLQQE